MLYLVATPVGDFAEITLRALDVLKTSEVIICESTKETSKLLRHHGVTAASYEVLDEHAKPADIEALAKLCATKTCALVSDGGTPGFCDPGAELVGLCRSRGIEVKSVLGPSSLMGLLSLAGRRFDQFVFRGFLPAETEARRAELKRLRTEKRALVLMDTPYRLKKLLLEVEETWPQRTCVLARDLSLPTEVVWTGKPAELRARSGVDKAEFMLLVLPEGMA